MNQIKLLVALFLGFYGNALIAQLPQSLQNNLKVVIDGDTLASPWGGGMNSPQFSALDLDLDGTMDMMVFDREDNSFATYLNVGTEGNRAYEYAPQYEKAFVECGCTDWALTADYNCDGLLDIVCGADSYIKAYKQVEKNQEIFFLPDYGNISSTFTNGFYLWIFSARVDIPAVMDYDNDGDIDILNWKLGFNFIEYHRNYAMEDFGRCDTFHMREETGCFGHFHEGSADNNLIFHDTTVQLLCPLGNFSPSAECGSFKRPTRNGVPVNDGRHTGSSTLVLDLDADNVYDLLIGDVSYNNINAVHNCGREDYAYMDSADNAFPSYDVPINMGLFPATFYVDVDNDDIRDLIVAACTTGRAENKYSTQLYLNKGADNYPDFKYKGRAFMQEDNIDQGSGTSPVFFDFNDDGLLDLLVGDGGIFDTLSKTFDNRMLLYQNVGNHDVPIYKLVDDDYLYFSRDSLAAARLAPAVGDLDNDGDMDMIVGAADGKLLYFENTAGPGNTAAFSRFSFQSDTIDVGGNAAPVLYDIDNDLDLDLFVGNLRGRISYYENTGSPTSFSFSLVTEEFGFIQALDKYGGRFEGNTKPCFVDYDNDNEVELLVGNIRGEIEVFEDLSKAFTDTLSVSTILFAYDFGSYSAPAAAVLDSTGDMTFVVGNQRGGLKLFNSLPDELPAPVSIDPDLLADFGITFYPNPARDGIWVEVDATQGKDVKLRIINLMGQQLSTHALPLAENYIRLEQLTAGMYLLQFEVEGRTLVKRLVKN